MRSEMERYQQSDQSKDRTDLHTQSPLVRVFLIGPFQLEWRVPSRDPDAWEARTSARTLFKLLLCAPNRQASKSQLAGMLWPETDDEKARQSLRTACKVLNKVLTTTTDESLLDTTHRDLLKLADQSRLWVDIDAFEQAITQASEAHDIQQALHSWLEAYRLLRGDFLTDDVLHHWIGTHWIKRRKQALKMARRRVIRQLADIYLQNGQAGRAEDILEAHVARFPTDQDALLRLLRLLAAQNCFSEIMTLYERAEQALAAMGKSPVPHIKTFVEHVQTQLALTQTGSLPAIPGTSGVEQNCVLHDKHAQHAPPGSRNDQESTMSSILSPLSATSLQSILELIQQGGETHSMPASRRDFLGGLLTLHSATSIPFDWWEHLTHANAPSMTEEEFAYFQQLIEDGWGLCNGGEWSLAEQVLNSFLPDVIRKASKQREAALLAAQGFVLRSILQIHQRQVMAMLPLCQQAVTYAKYANDPTIICASLNGLAVAFKYNQRGEDSFRTYLEALSYCDQAAPLIRSRIYAGAAAAFARKGRKHEADPYIHLAHEHFPEDAQKDPHFLSADHGQYMLAYYQGIAFLDLNQPQEAWATFEQYRESISAQDVPQRNHLEIINNQGRAAILSKNLDGYAHCLQEGIAGAQELQSQKRRDEAILIFRNEMPTSWRKTSQLTQIIDQYPFLQEVM